MKSKIANTILLAIITFTVVAGAAAYPYLPDQIISHWNAAGEADGSMSKFWGIFMFPLMMLAIYALYLVIPKIDPLRANIRSFRNHYNAFWVYAFVFFLYIFCLMMAWNFGLQFNFTVAIVPATAALLYLVGAILEKTKRNWFMGIRTPWTLSNDAVWERTHKLGGRLFKIAAAVSLLGLFFRNDLSIVAFLAVPAAVIAVVTIVYSYFEFKKHHQL